MSQNEYGLYGYLFTIIGLFSLIFNFGLYLAQSKLYHDYSPEEKKSLIFTINIILLTLLILTFSIFALFHFDKILISFLFSHPFNYDAYRSVLFLAVLVTIYDFMVQNFFITSENIKKYQLYNFLKLVLINPIVIYLMFVASADKVMIRLKYTFLIELVILFVFCIYYIKQMHPVFKWMYAKKAMKIGIPAMMTSILGTVYSFSDKFILEKYGTFSDLAIYSLALTIAGIIMVIFSSFQSVLLPFFFKEKDIEKNFNKTKSIIKKMTVVFLLIGVAIWMAIKIALLFGIIDIKYKYVLFILPILLVTQILQAISQLYNNYITYFEVVYVGTISVLFFSLFNIGINLFLIPRFNIYGASISALIITIFSTSFYYYYVKRMCIKNNNLKSI
jgi:O-antigen/teichoic acid export membrane protein